jgi:hypothetical protein
MAKAHAANRPSFGPKSPHDGTTAAEPETLLRRNRDRNRPSRYPALFTSSFRVLSSLFITPV